jgi:hypothetical protein
MPLCTCPVPCLCEAMCAARFHRLEDQVIQLLTGLNDNLNVVKSQVLLMDPLPSINKVYSLVIQEESNNYSTSITPAAEDSSILINATEGRKPFGRGKGNNGPRNNLHDNHLYYQLLIKLYVQTNTLCGLFNCFIW